MADEGTDTFTFSVTGPTEIKATTFAGIARDMNRLLRACGAGTVTVRSVASVPERPGVDIVFAVGPKSAVEALEEIIDEAKRVIASRRTKGNENG